MKNVVQQIQEILQTIDDLQKQGDYQQAILLAEEACDLAHRHLGGQHDLLGQSLGKLAGLYKAIQNYEEAEPLYLESLQILRTVYQNSHPKVVKGLNDLAELYRQVGAYNRALPLYEEALEVLNKLGGANSLDAATVKQNMALVYVALGSYQRSAFLLEESLKSSMVILGEDHPDIATTKDNLGFAYFELGEYERAAELHSQALDIYRKTIGVQHPDVAMCLNNLAMAYQKLGRSAEALPLCQQAMEIDLMFFGAQSPAYATSVHNLGFLYLDLGDYRDAELHLWKALEIRQRNLGNEHPDVRSSLATVADLYADTSREAEALDLLEQRAAVDERLLDQVFSSFAASQKLDYLATLQVQFHRFVSLVMKSGTNLASVIQRGFTFVLRRKGLSVEAMEIPSGVLASRQEQSPWPQYQEFIGLRTQFNRAKIAGPKQESRWEYDERLSYYSQELERLENDLIRRVRGISLYDRLQKVTPEAVARALPVDSTLIEYVDLQVIDFSPSNTREETKQQPSHYIAFVLPAGAPEQVQMIDLGEVAPIDALITEFRSQLTGEVGKLSSSTANHPLEMEPDNPSRHIESARGSRFLNVDIGKRLRALIFDPLLESLNNGKRIILAPDGKLSLLPFEILPLDNDRFLIDDYQLSYLNVGREVLRFGVRPPGSPSRSLVVAAPDYDLGTKEEDFVDKPTNRPIGNLYGIAKNLPAATQEGAHIAHLLEAQLLVGETALGSAVKACRSPLILHIATHAYFETEYVLVSQIDIHPSHVYLEDVADLPFGRYHWFWKRTERSPLMRSCLLFAGFNTWLRGGSPPAEAEEGIVTAADILNMDLQDTELVVLSACETGVGDVLSLEGVFGLRRAFILAGAKTLVSSLWQVPDYHTQELMSNFFEHLLRGLPREQALREAQLTMKARYPDPFYWGAFICQGAPDKIFISPSASVDQS